MSELQSVREAMAGSEVLCGDKCHSWPSVALYGINEVSASLLIVSCTNAQTAHTRSR